MIALKYFVDFSYCGTSFHGWQKQPNASSVQETMEHAFSMLLGIPIELIGAGRTDTGVHAKKMIAHFLTEAHFQKSTLTARLNAFLPPSIAINTIYKVSDQAHARFSASSRTYEYWVSTHKNPFLNTTAHFVHQHLDIVSMNQASQILINHQDFECFSKTHSDVHTFLCDISKASWEQKGDLLIFTITANRFLRNMVRAIVGTLLEIGTHKKNIIDMEAVIASKSRSLAGPSVPAQGLYLTEINYPKNIYV